MSTTRTLTRPANLARIILNPKRTLQSRAALCRLIRQTLSEPEQEATEFLILAALADRFDLRHRSN